MSSVTVTPEGTIAILERQLADMRARAVVAMHEATAVVAEELRLLAPGSLGSHVAQRVGGGQGEVTGTVFPMDRWAKYVDQGTGVYVSHHVIGPKAARRQANPRAAMKLGDGTFRRQVRGQRGQHFIARARDQAEARVLLILERPADEAIRKLTG